MSRFENAFRDAVANAERTVLLAQIRQNPQMSLHDLAALTMGALGGIARGLTIGEILGDAGSSRSAPAVKRPEAKKPEAKRPEAKEPEAKKPEAKKPEAKKPEAKRPEAKKPEAKKPEAKKPEAKKPEAKKPEAKKPEAKTPTPAVEAAPEMAAPAMTAPASASPPAKAQKPAKRAAKVIDTRTPEGRQEYDKAILMVVEAAAVPISAEEIRRTTGGTSLQARVALARLVEAGAITWIGQARGTRYVKKQAAA